MQCECGVRVVMGRSKEARGAGNAGTRSALGLDGVRKERGFLAVVDGWINGVKSNVLQVFTGVALGTIRDYIFRLDKMGEALRDHGRGGEVQGRVEGIIVETDECLVKQGKEDVWVVGVLEERSETTGRARRHGRQRS